MSSEFDGRTDSYLDRPVDPLSASDSEIRDYAIEEARMAMDRQLDAITPLRTNVIRLLSLDVVFITVVVALFRYSRVISADGESKILFLLPLAPFILVLIMGAATLPKVNPEIGFFKPQLFVSANEADELEGHLIREYSDMLESNRRIITKARKRIQQMFYILIGGIAMEVGVVVGYLG
jgi:hypothetical protein